MYSQPVLIHVNVSNKQFATSEKCLLKGERSLSADMGIVFTELLPFGKMI